MASCQLPTWSDHKHIHHANAETHLHFPGECINIAVCHAHDLTKQILREVSLSALGPSAHSLSALQTVHPPA